MRLFEPTLGNALSSRYARAGNDLENDAAGSVYPYYYVPEQTTRLDVDMAAEAEAQLKEMAKTSAAAGVSLELRVEEGMIADTILALAQKERVDLIVMGTHGRMGPDRLMLGSVTEKVLRKASCPVLAVRKPAHDFVNPAPERRSRFAAQGPFLHRFLSHCHKSAAVRFFTRDGVQRRVNPAARARRHEHHRVPPGQGQGLART